MKLYRIFTESNAELDGKSIALASQRFASFTAYHAIGYWAGQREASLVIEVMADTSNEGAWHAARKLCEDIRETNSQACVLLQTLDVEGEFI